MALQTARKDMIKGASKSEITLKFIVLKKVFCKIIIVKNGLM
ncbi:hypothetical protein RU88_GL000008 [Lactococcus raffinolactis]|nr:hypothetical protein RU88_GL000008 [Lactococcus raffinolactis]